MVREEFEATIPESELVKTFDTLDRAYILIGRILI
jgi:hypothetical protein